MKLEQRVFKNNGKRFEVDFKESFPATVWTYRPPDTGGGQLARFTQESLCDLMVYDTISKDLKLFELKSTLGTSFGFRPFEECQAYEKEKVNLDIWLAEMTPEERKQKKEEISERRKKIKGLYKGLNQAMIKYHQIETLSEISRDYGIPSYLAFTFFKEVGTYVISIDNFIDKFWKKTSKKSINQQDLMTLVAEGSAYKVNQEYVGRSMRSIYDLSAFISKQELEIMRESKRYFSQSVSIKNNENIFKKGVDKYNLI